MNAKRFFAQFGRGCSMGLGMVPGVSAGTLAVIVGIYDELIDALSSLRKEFKRSFVRLLPIVLGILIASALVLLGVHFFYSKAEFIICCVFAGFVLGTIPLIANKVGFKNETGKKIIGIVIGFIVAAGIGALSVISKLYWGLDFSAAFIEGRWWTYLACLVAGFIAAAACIVPGISGAMILFIFGLYNPCVGIYAGADSMFHNHDRILSGLGLTAAILVGGLLGIILTAKGMRRLMEKRREITFSVVFGFVLGSIVSIFCNQSLLNDANEWAYSRTPTWAYIVGSILFVGVAVGFYFVSRYATKSKEKAEEQSASVN